MSDTSKHRLLMVVGARPNFMKAAAVLPTLAKYNCFETTLVHTGQHYDTQMSDIMFEQLQLPRPDVSLEVGSGTHAVQTAQIMMKLETYLLEQQKLGRPIDRVLDVGDVNSTLAATLVAAKLNIPVAHIEAGLRSGDRTMPEEVNRVVTDALADMLFCSETAAVTHLKQEGRPESAIHLVGNVMIDTLRHHLSAALNRPVLSELKLAPKSYGVVTLHRPATVDQPDVLHRVVNVLLDVANEIPLVFSVHPRTAARLRETSLAQSVERLQLLPPLGYLDFLSLTAQSRLIITDSGGLQEEATALEIPCLTAREHTERPITVEEGTSVLVGSDPKLIRQGVTDILQRRYKQGKCPALWDGQAAPRIAEVLAQSVTR